MRACVRACMPLPAHTCVLRACMCAFVHPCIRVCGASVRRCACRWVGGWASAPTCICKCARRHTCAQAGQAWAGVTWPHRKTVPLLKRQAVCAAPHDNSTGWTSEFFCAASSNLPFRMGAEARIRDSILVSISASPKAYLALGCRHAGAPFDRLDESLMVRGAMPNACLYACLCTYLYMGL